MAGQAPRADQRGLTSLRRAPRDEAPPAVEPAPPAAPGPPLDQPSDPPPDQPLFRWRDVAQSPLTVLVMVSIALGLLAGGLASAYVYSRPTAYRSDADLLIDQGRAIGAAKDSGEILKLARLRLKYAAIVDSVFFDQPVADRARLPLATVQKSLVPTADPGSLVLRLSATMPTRKQAQELAGVAAQFLVSFVQQEQSAYDVPREQQITFTVLNGSTPPTRVAPDAHRALLVGAVTFAVVGIVGFRSTDAVRRRTRRRRR